MDSKDASAYLIDPLHEPQAHEETGLNAHFRSTFAPAERIDPPLTSTKHRKQQSQDTNPFRKSSTSHGGKNETSVQTRPVSSHSGYPTPPASASPQQTAFNHRQDAFGTHNDAGPSRTTRPRRSSSLNQRYPGDESHKPLDVIRRDSKRAQRAPHLRKQHIPGPDTIDRLDQINGRYHHEGPYDAALLARNTSYKNSPVAAVSGTSAEALRATPRENVVDAIKGHRPLDGVAAIPPGGTDRFGREYRYKEGDNIHDDGERNFSIDLPLKDHYGRGGDPSEGVELQTRRQRSSTLDHNDRPNVTSGREVLGSTYEGPRRHASMGKQAGLKQRLGNIRKRN